MKNNINYMLVTYSDFAILYYSCNYKYSFSFLMHFTMNMSLPSFSHNTHTHTHTHTHMQKNTNFEAHRYVLKQQRFNNNERTCHGEKNKVF